MKVGRTEAGVRAAKSHTAAIAGADDVYNAALKQAGVIRVDEVSELFDVAAALLTQPLPKGRRVGILTSGGGFGCVSTDACERAGLDVAPLSPVTIERLNDVLPPRWPHANPVDTVAAGFVTYPCLWPLMEDENLDAVMAINCVAHPAAMREMTDNIPPSMRQKMEETFDAQENEELNALEKVLDYMHRYHKPFIVCRHASEELKKSHTYKKLEESGILMYPTPERAAKVLAHLVEYSEYLNH